MDYTYDNASGLLVAIARREGQADSYHRTQYAYDLAGQRIREKTAIVSTLDGAELDIAQDNHITYDRMGRVREIADTHFHVEYGYDDAGNREHVVTTYSLPTWGSVPGKLPATFVPGLTGEDSGQRVETWNAYDAMNRQTVVDGVKLANGTVGISATQGQQIVYDNAGNRILVKQAGKQLKLDTATGQWSAVTGEAVETYSYDAAGRLTSTFRDGLAIEERLYDALGRVVQSGPAVAGVATREELDDALEDAGIDRDVTITAYTPDGQVNVQRTKRWHSDGLGTAITHQYDQATGRLQSYTVYPEGGGGSTTYTYEYEDFETSQVKRIKGTRDSGQEAITTNTYDALGNLKSVTSNGEANSSARSVITDAQGRVLRRYMADGHVTRTLIANGEVIGSSTDSGALQPSTFTSNYVPTNDASLTGGPTSYTVREGDTFQGIAKAVWGNADLWYLIAEANAASTLQTGEVIRIPTQPNTVYNDFDTFRPYDASQAIGDTTPDIPLPKKKTNAFKQLVMVIITVVVAIYTAGALASALGNVTAASAATGAAATTSTFSTGLAALGGGTATVGGVTTTIGAGMLSGTAAAVSGAAVGSAAGSLAGQVFGVASGMQDKINWRGVALSAVSGGMAAGIGSMATAGSFLDKIGAAGRAALGNAATQGIGIVTGLQDKLDWRGVAASAVGAGVGASVGPQLGETFGGRLATGLIAGTAATVMRGGRIAIQQVAIDAFGNALGSSLAAQSTSSGVAPAANTPLPDADGTFYGPAAQLPALDSVAVWGNTPYTLTPSNTSNDVLLAAGAGYTGGVPSSSLRDENIARMLRMANDPSASSSFVNPRDGLQPDGSYRVTIVLNPSQSTNVQPEQSSFFPAPETVGSGVTTSGRSYYAYDSGTVATAVPPQHELQGVQLAPLGAQVATDSTVSSFMRGISGDYWSALDGEKPLSYSVGSAVHAAAGIVWDGLAGAGDFGASGQAFKKGHYLESAMYGLRGVATVGLTAVTAGDFAFGRAALSTASKQTISNTGSSGTFYNVASNGVRGEIPLTLEQRSRVQSYLSKFDMDGVTVRWVDDRNLNTAYGEMFGERILNIGSDVVPGNVGAGTLTANSRVSIKGTLAHELVGHREAAMAGRTQDLLYLEEAQASIRAARFGPDLTLNERFTLLRDAITRLQNAPGGPVRIRDVKDSLFIQHR